MPDHFLPILRWILLASAVINLLQATVLFHLFQRWLLRPWFGLQERVGGTIPAFMRDERIQRAWPLLMAILFLVAWWYVGTPAGAGMLYPSAS